MNREEAHALIEEIFRLAELKETADNAVEDAPKERVLPEGKRVVRTKSSGDRVYMLDDVKKTRQWVTNPDVLTGLGFEIADVVDVDDSELLKYQMASALYKAPDATA